MEKARAVIDRIKAASENDAQVLAAIVDDQNAIRVLAAWPFASHRWTPPSGDPPEKNPLEWAWENHDVDCAELSAASNVPVYRIPSIVRRLRMLRLIFPDGTISKPAGAILVGYVGTRVGPRRSGKKRGGRGN